MLLTNDDRTLQSYWLEVINQWRPNSTELMTRGYYPVTTEHYRITDSRLLSSDDRTLQNYWLEVTIRWRQNYCFGNTLHLHSGGASFEFQPGYRLFWLGYFEVNFSPSRQIPKECLRLGQQRVLPHPFRFIAPYLRTILWYIAQSTDTVHKQNAGNKWMFTCFELRFTIL
jgi:hypothetical protein